jgi:hypothetical protein
VRRRTPLLVTLAFANCSSPRQIAETEWTPAPSPDLGVVVARVGQVPIFAKQVEAQAVEMGIPVRSALEALIDSNLLAEAARKRKYPIAGSSDPDVRSALVQRLLEKELEPNLRLESIPDSDLLPLYNRVRGTFVHPRLVEIAVLAVYTGAAMPKQFREQREQTAKELAQFLKSHPAKTLDDFSALARDPKWSSRHVTFRHMLQGTDKPLSRAVGAEVSKLHAPGDTTPLVVDIDGGFIARYIGDRPPENIGFEQVRGKLAAGFFERWRRQRFLEYTSKLARLHHVEMYPDRLPSNEQGL